MFNISAIGLILSTYLIIRMVSMVFKKEESLLVKILCGFNIILTGFMSVGFFLSTVAK